MIPKILDIISWIDRELDEEAREDFFRLKKVTDNKKKLQEAALDKPDPSEAQGNEAEPEVTVIPTMSELGLVEDDDDDLFV
jgi:hypothetical protein